MYGAANRCYLLAVPDLNNFLGMQKIKLLLAADEVSGSYKLPSVLGQCTSSGFDMSIL